MKKFILFIFCALFGGIIANANDTAGQLLPTGEIRFEKQNGIVLKHEALLLSDTVTVDYLFENITDKPIETTVFFPIPTIGPVEPYYTESPHNFEFRVWTNGKEIKPELNRKVTLDGTDVTKYFNLMGIDAYYKAVPYDDLKAIENLVQPLLKLPSEEQKKLEELGMIVKSCMDYQFVPYTDRNIDDNCEKGLADYELAIKLTTDPDFFERTGTKLPSYIDPKNKNLSPINQVVYHYQNCRKFLPVERKCLNNTDIYHFGPDPYYSANAHYKQEVMYHWKQTFPPHKTIHVRHEYKPSWVENGMYQPESPLVWKIVQEDEERKKLHWGGAASYIITTANNWKTPIGQFNMLVFGEEGAAISASKASYVRISPKNYLLETKQDFVPTDEIMFDLAGSTKIIPQLYRIDGPANVRTKPDGKKIKTLENNSYIWAYPSDTKDWYIVLLDEETTGYTNKNNLIPFGKLD